MYISIIRTLLPFVNCIEDILLNANRSVEKMNVLKPDFKILLGIRF